VIACTRPPIRLETHLFWGQKVKGQGQESQKSIAGVRLCTLVSAGFYWLLLCPLRVGFLNLLERKEKATTTNRRESNHGGGERRNDSNFVVMQLLLRCRRRLAIQLRQTARDLEIVSMRLSLDTENNEQLIVVEEGRRACGICVLSRRKGCAVLPICPSVAYPLH